MIDGEYVYYTIQHRIIHKSPINNPGGVLIPVLDEEWLFSNWDVFGKSFEPWINIDGTYGPLCVESYNDKDSLWLKTLKNGWFSLKYAIQGLKRVREDSKTNRFDIYDQHQNRIQAIKYEFRIVQMTISQSTVYVPYDELTETTCHKQN